MGKIADVKIRIAFKWVALSAYAILVIPILLFFAGWLKWYLAVLFSSILLVGTFWAIKKDYWNNTDVIEIPVRDFLAVGILFAFWIFISGSCYTSLAHGDILWRNTTLQDLVNYDWPVYYPDRNGYLCYYFIFWLVPALFAKISGGGLEATYIELACWIFFILMVAFLLIVYYFRDYSRPVIKTICFFMIMWSGINILGQFLMNHMGLYPNPAGFGSNEGYCDALRNADGLPFCFLYRSNNDFLCQCYNQLPIWIVVPLMMQNRKIYNYAFWGLLLFPFSPWGTVGIALMMLVDAFAFLARNKSISKFVKEVLSVPNLCAAFSIFPVFYLFFACDNISAGSQKFGIIKLGELTPKIFIGILIFWVCEFGIYYYLTWDRYKSDYLYVSLFAMLLLMPFIWVSSRHSRDFCMDATLPQLYVLMIYVIGYIKDTLLNEERIFIEKCKVRNCLLVMVLGLAATTPLFDWMNQSKAMCENNSISLQYKSVMSFADILGYEGGFQIPVSTDVDEKAFFRVFAKPVDREKCRWLPISAELSDIRKIDNIDEYFDYLNGKDCTVFIAVQDIQGYSLTKETLEKIKQIGFDENLDLLLEHEYHSFLGIVNNGQIVTEKIGGDEYLTYSDDAQADWGNVWMESGTLYNGNCAVINIGDGHYSAHGRGLNIAVWDHAAGRVIDAVSFDTHTDEMLCMRKKQ